MNIWKKRALLLLMAMLLCLTCVSCAADVPTSTQPQPTSPALLGEPEWTIYEETASLFAGGELSVTGAVGEEWAIIALARSGQLRTEVANAYIEAAAEYVESIGSVRLHKSKCTDNARMILALTAIGGDVTNVGGYNLLEGLTEMDYVTKQGNNGPIWALIAMNSGNYTIPEAANPDQQVTREGLVQYILSVQCDDGGWGLAGGASDIDITAMALQALASYQQEEQVAAAAEKALQYLSNAQSTDGGFVGYGVSTSETCAQVIVALTAWKIDPDTDSRFVKNGHSVLDALCGFAVDGGGFCHMTEAPQRNGVATEQGFYSLVAYCRFLENKSSLYDMAA